MHLRPRPTLHTTACVALLTLLASACTKTSTEPAPAEPASAEDQATAEPILVEAEPEGGPTPPEEAPSTELPPPTEEELAAWDRKDPDGEKHLYKWDKANEAKMHAYWLDLRCMRAAMKEAGEDAFGAPSGSKAQKQWDTFKQTFIVPVVNAWLQDLFKVEGSDILTKSKYMVYFLEAHELIMNGYPRAYNESEEVEIQRQDALWIVVENEVVDYSNKIGAPLQLPDPITTSTPECGAVLGPFASPSK